MSTVERIYVVIRGDRVGVAHALKTGDLVIYERLAAFVRDRDAADILFICTTPLERLLTSTRDYRKVA